MWLLLPILLVLHVVVCLLLVLVVLMQLPRSEGLGAAFGGTVTENIFGAQTTHVLAKFTVWLGVAFFAITLMLAVAYSHRDRRPEPDSARITEQRRACGLAIALVQSCTGVEFGRDCACSGRSCSHSPSSRNSCVRGTLVSLFPRER